MGGSEGGGAVGDKGGEFEKYETNDSSYSYEKPFHEVWTQSGNFDFFGSSESANCQIAFLRFKKTGKDGQTNDSF